MLEYFYDVCNGNNVLAHTFRQGDGVRNTLETRQPLSCAYSPGLNIGVPSPFHLIGPAKVEEVSTNPMILIIHDMLFDSEIKELLLSSDIRAQSMVICSLIASPLFIKTK
jgi:hypothetical protein